MVNSRQFRNRNLTWIFVENDVTWKKGVMYLTEKIWRPVWSTFLKLLSLLRLLTVAQIGPSVYSHCSPARPDTRGVRETIQGSHRWDLGVGEAEASWQTHDESMVDCYMYLPGSSSLGDHWMRFGYVRLYTIYTIPDRIDKQHQRLGRCWYICLPQKINHSCTVIYQSLPWIRHGWWFPSSVPGAKPLKCWVGVTLVELFFVEYKSEHWNYC